MSHPQADRPTPTRAAEHLGLFDFPDYRDLVASLARVLGREEGEVHERLFREAVQTGWNVSTASSWP
jgi:hypothetical protein